MTTRETPAGPSTPAATAAASAIADAFDAVASQLPKACRGKKPRVKAVHNLRVSARRARAAVDSFSALIDDDAAKKASKVLRRIRRAAGPARDADVEAKIFAARLDSLGPDDPADAARALAYALASIRHERRGLQKGLAALAERHPPGKVRKVARAAIESAASRSSGDSPSLADLARTVVGGALREVEDRGAADLGRIENLHALRIACKRLRYTVELFETAFAAGAAERALAVLATTQNVFGAVTDAHRLIDRLETLRAGLDDADSSLIKRAKADRARIAAGLAELLAAQRAEALDRHAEAVVAWTALDLSAVERLVAAPRGPDRDRIAAAAPSNGATARKGEPRESAPGAGRRRLATIDVGTNSVRLLVAQVRRDGSLRVLDDEREITRLGRGLHKTGLMDSGAIERTAEVVAKFRGIATGYEAEAVRVIGTAAMREAANGDLLARRIRECAGEEITAISAEEEARLAFRSAGRAFDLTAAPAAVVDIGGGSVEIILSARGVIERIYSLPLGAVRMTERFGGPEACARERFDEMRRALRDALEAGVGEPPVQPAIIIGTGGTFTALAMMAIHAQLGPDAEVLAADAGRHQMNRSDVRHILDRLRRLSVRERGQTPGLSADRADIIVAGLAAADAVMKHLNVNRLRVHDGGIREGLLLAMADELLGDHEPPDAMRSVRRFARDCDFERPHAHQVARLATSLFDQLAGPTGPAWRDVFTPRNRLLLEAAGLLHDVGYLVNYAGHHRHGFHMIANADLPGLTRRETDIIANLARYHRRSEPKLKHRAFARLDGRDQRLVRALAAILRVADGLDRTHTQAVDGISLGPGGDDMLLTVRAASEPAVDIWGSQRKSGLFRAIFGSELRYRFEPAAPEAPPADGADRPAKPARQEAEQDGQPTGAYPQT